MIRNQTTHGCVRVIFILKGWITENDEISTKSTNENYKNT